MSAKPQTPKAVTANRLSDGIVIFYTPEGAWSEQPGDAAAAGDKAAQQALLAAAQESPEAVDAYLIEVAFDESGRPYPSRNRERIRALGPTVRTDLGKQAEREG